MVDYLQGKNVIEVQKKWKGDNESPKQIGVIDEDELLSSFYVKYI